MQTNELAELVVRHRDRDSPVLHVDWALLRLLDVRYCSTLEKDLRRHAGPWEVHSATQALWEMIPSKPGLYMFVWRPPFVFDVASAHKPSSNPCQVIYVGMAGAGSEVKTTLRERYKSYRRYLNGSAECIWDPSHPITRSKLLERYLTLRPLEYWFAVVEDRAQIELLEDRLIQLLNPPINRRRAPKLRRGRTQPAFSDVTFAQ